MRVLIESLKKMANKSRAFSEGAHFKTEAEARKAAKILDRAGIKNTGPYIATWPEFLRDKICVGWGRKDDGRAVKLIKHIVEV